MKILSLRLLNLNSLYGEWQIDFQHPDYLQNGLFAITGPTGAGKSTILDAICLALFAQTPRLRNISKNDNEIMSRGSGHCMAEVVFAIGKNRYRSRWSQSRARGKATGKLQEAKHELADADSGKIIEEKKTRTLQAVEGLTHLNFQRFTRSVLLAQGSFAAFLQASVDERSDMLQQITGTEIYEDISKQVFANKRDAELQLQLLQSVLQGIALLNEDEIIALKQRHTELQAENQQQHDILNSLRQRYQAQARWLDLQKQQQQWQSEQQQQQQRQQDFAPQQLRLEQALAAANLNAEFQRVNLLRQQKQQALQQQQRLQDALPHLLEAQQSQHALWQQQHSALLSLQEQHQQQQQLWQQVEALDIRIDASNLRQQEWNEQVKLQRQLCVNSQARLLELEEEQQQQQEQLERVIHLLTARNLETAAQKLSQWQQQYQQVRLLQSMQQEQQQAAADITLQLQQKSQEAQELQTVINATAERQQQLAQNLQQTSSSIEGFLGGKSISEYELERDLLQQQQLLLAKIESLEDERQHLHEGEACPLCGSTSHPYVDQDNTLPNLSATEARLNELNDLLKNIAQQQRLQQQWQSNHALMQMQFDARQQDRQRLQDGIAQLEANHQKTQQKITQLQQDINQLQGDWNEFGYQAGEDAARLLELLKHQVEHWLRYQQLKQQHQETLALLNKDLELAQQQANQANRDLQSLQQDSDTHQHKLQVLQQERRDLFGDEEVAQQKRQWQQRLQDAALRHEEAHAKWQQAQQQCQQTQQRLDDATQQLKHTEDTLLEQEQQWQQQLQQHAFANEQAWQTQLLPADELQALQQQAQQLQQRAIELAQTQQHLALALQELNIEHVDADEQQQLQQRLLDLQDAYQQHTQSLGAIKQQLQQQQQAEERAAAQLQQIQTQQQECNRWRELNDLIGSSDGKKYRLFAQSLTFNHLVRLANAQLKHMSDRYVLQQNPEALLQLEVIDQYQAGTVRSSKNLSGGESFIVSLALALGLARMASDSTQIDSLFLDEGFGTLDEDALDVALNTLASLQQEGKLIGVISHVGALKERIATQIQVEPKHSGQSRLSGSGIRELTAKAV